MHGAWGFGLAFAGDWENGCALIAQAAPLNPNHPGWYWYPSCFNAYRKRDYRAALDIAVKVNLPGLVYTSEVIAAAHGQLGEREAAGKALRDLLTLRPDFAVVAREVSSKWCDSELVEHLMDGLRKAGLDVADDEGTVPAQPAATTGS